MVPDSRDPVEKKIERKPPSIKFYFFLFLIAFFFLLLTLLSSPGIWQNIFINLFTDLLIAVVIIIFVEQKLRDSDINLVKEFYNQILVLFWFYLPFVSPRYSMYIDQVLNNYDLTRFNKNYVSRNLDQILENSNENFYIAGMAGSGKTSILIHIFSKKIIGASKNKDAKIPILINAIDVKNTIKESLLAQIEAFSRISQKRFDADLQKGSFLIIIDDVYPDFRQKTWEDIVHFVSEYPSCQYFFAGQLRNADNITELKNFKEITIPHFTNEESAELYSKLK